MRAMRGRRLTLVIVALVSLWVGALVARPYVHGLSFVVRAAQMHGTLRRIADRGAATTREREITIPAARGALRARIYEPARTPHRAALLVSGLHPAGIDEPRLVALARQLSASGLSIVTPDIPELSRFEITPATTDAIEQAAVWLSSETALSPDGRVGLMGISFSGGLAVVTAGRKSMADHTAFTAAFGGYDDLPRVLRYLCTGVEERPRHEVRLNPGAADDQEPFARPPDAGGVAVILLGIADRVVPPSQVEPLRAAVRRFLSASYLDRVDPPQSEREFAALREVAKRMPQPSATLLRYVNERDVIHLGPRLLPFVGVYGGHPALSPSKSPKPSAPVFLLHGRDDNVIPAVESEYLAEDLRGHAPARLLLSGLISHAEADRPLRFSEAMQLAGFWGDLLSR
jgi:dienelactone hydrolase